MSWMLCFQRRCHNPETFRSSVTGPLLWLLTWAWLGTTIFLRADRHAGEAGLHIYVGVNDMMQGLKRIKKKKSQDMSQIQNVNNLWHFSFAMQLRFSNTRWESKGKQTHWEEERPASLGDSDPDQVWLLLFSGIKTPAVKHVTESEPTEIYGVTRRAWITEHAKRWFSFGRGELYFLLFIVHLGGRRLIPNCGGDVDPQLDPAQPAEENTATALPFRFPSFTWI